MDAASPQFGRISTAAQAATAAAQAAANTLGGGSAAGSGAATGASETAPQKSDGGCGCGGSGNGGSVDAATGGGLAGDSSLSSMLGRLAEAVEALKQMVQQLAQRMAGGAVLGLGANGGGPVTTWPPAAPGSQAALGNSPIQQSPIQGGGPLPISATNRVSAIPELIPGQSEGLRLARNQVTYRRVSVMGAAGGTQVSPPTVPAGVSVEMYALRDYQRGAHRTQVLEPVTGPVTVPAGETVSFVARIKGDSPGDTSFDFAGAKLQVHVGTKTIDALPMMAWINDANATKRGASTGSVSSVLAHFGVAATGNTGVAVSSASNRSPVQYFNASFEAANRTSPADAARRIVDAERKAQAANPGSKFWVQVSDEQDGNASQVSGTVSWIKELRRNLASYGSQAKLFVAAQARDFNLPYASVVDGWATTQSSVGESRSAAISKVRSAASAYGHNIELLEYPGNAFFDGATSGSSAISTASAALDGASGWFIYSANNLDNLERGGGDEGRGDIGGLIAIDGGRVLPTIALIEAELGANLGSTARSVGATTTAGAYQVAQSGRQLDAYQHTGGQINLRQWEAEIGRLID